MAEILRLDPFQMVRSWVAPEPLPETVVGRFIFRMDVNPPTGGSNPVQISLCDGGQATVDIQGWWRYFSQNNDFLYSELAVDNCQDLKITLLGRTSGLRYEIPFNLKAFLGWNACFTQFCYVTRPDLGGRTERWAGDSSNGITQLQVNQLYSPVDLGFIDNEICDLEIPAPPLHQISLISQRSAFEVYVDTVTPHDFPEFSNCELLDAGPYTGQYEVNIVSPTRIWVSKRYDGDLSNQGTAWRYYNQVF